jgi:hypothetical protein
MKKLSRNEMKNVLGGKLAMIGCSNNCPSGQTAAGCSYGCGSCSDITNSSGQVTGLRKCNADGSFCWDTPCTAVAVAN